MTTAEPDEQPRRADLVQRRRALVELTNAEIDEMTAGRMSRNHDYLNALLDTE